MKSSCSVTFAKVNIKLGKEFGGLELRAKSDVPRETLSDSVVFVILNMVNSFMKRKFRARVSAEEIINHVSKDFNHYVSNRVWS